MRPFVRIAVTTWLLGAEFAFGSSRRGRYFTRNARFPINLIPDASVSHLRSYQFICG
jgi:hypothetical protein